MYTNLQRVTSASVLPSAMAMELTARMGSIWAHRMSEMMRTSATMTEGAMDAFGTMTATQRRIAREAAANGAAFVEGATGTAKDGTAEAVDAVQEPSAEIAEEAETALDAAVKDAAKMTATAIDKAEPAPRAAVEATETAADAIDAAAKTTAVETGKLADAVSTAARRAPQKAKPAS